MIMNCSYFYFLDALSIRRERRQVAILALLVSLQTAGCENNEGCERGANGCVTDRIGEEAGIDACLSCSDSESDRPNEAGSVDDASNPCNDCQDAGTNDSPIDSGIRDIGYYSTESGPVISCGEFVTESVSWDESTDIGVSPADAFSSVPGSCTALLKWDATGFNLISSTPASGETEITVTVEVDKESATISKSIPASSLCPASLRATAHVQLQTADDAFRDDWNTILIYDEGFGFRPIILSRNIADHEGSFSVVINENENAQLSYTLDGGGSDCSGKIELYIDGHDGGIGYGFGGLFGSWSNSGCAVGETTVDLQYPLAEGKPPVADAIERVWGDASYPAVWEDGTQTELKLRLDIDASSGCREDRPVAAASFQAKLTYSTSDGRLLEHQAEVDVNASLTETWELRWFDLYLNETLQCDDENDVLPYAFKDCTQLRSVQILGGLEIFNGTLDPSAPGFNIFEYYRQHAGAPGAADAMHVLKLDLD